MNAQKRDDVRANLERGKDILVQRLHSMDDHDRDNIVLTINDALNMIEEHPPDEDEEGTQILYRITQALEKVAENTANIASVLLEDRNDRRA